MFEIRRWMGTPKAKSSHLCPALAQEQMAGDLEEATVNCVDAWISKLLDGKTLTESEVVQLCNKVRLLYRYLSTIIWSLPTWSKLRSLRLFPTRFFAL